MELTELGYPVVSNEVHKGLFGQEKSRKMEPRDKWRAENLLESFGISTPVDYPENLYNGPIPLPGLKEGNLMDHFNKVAEEQVGHYKVWADAFASCELPKPPSVGSFVYQPGWTRYEWVESEGKFKTESVPYPLENAFTFDTETFVQEGAYPIIGTAVSDKACYIWLASELIDFTIEKDQWDQFKMIPIGKGRFIAGHNISYDRVRTREAYSLENTGPENFFFDTLSAHIGVSGLASEQRWLYTLSEKDPGSLNEEERSILRKSPQWLEEGSTNSLVKCYNFHVCEKAFFKDNYRKPMELGDKRIRNIFVVSEYLYEIAAEMEKVVDYAMKDSVYTAELFQALWPKYIDNTPSMVALCGHHHLNGSIVPVVDDWFDWIKNTEDVFDSYNGEMTKLCKDLMWKVYDEWKSIVKSRDGDEGYELAKEWVEKDPWISQLDWEVKSKRGKYAGVPNWIRDYIKDPDKNIGVRSRLSHLLLRLEWSGKPITWRDGEGWCYHEDDKAKSFVLS